jgi:hypothetical protein
VSARGLSVYFKDCALCSILVSGFWASGQVYLRASSRTTFSLARGDRSSWEMSPSNCRCDVMSSSIRSVIWSKSPASSESSSFRLPMVCAMRTLSSPEATRRVVRQGSDHDNFIMPKELCVDFGLKYTHNYYSGFKRTL